MILFSLLTTYVQRPTIKADSKPIMGRNSRSRSQSNRPIQPVQFDEGGNDLDIPEEQWPKVARLSVGGLTQQGRFIQEICRDAIWIVEVTLVTQDAWPELHKGILYKRQVLIEVINALRADKDRKQDTEYEALHNRILEDDKFIRTIGKWVR